MGRDLRQIGYNRNLYPDKCYLYDSTAVERNKLKQEAKPICRFYKKDTVPFQWQRVTVNGIVSSRLEFIGTIETVDHLEEARPDMFVVDQSGVLFIIVAPIISDDADKTKAIGTRPTVKTTLTLRGVF